MDQEKYQKAVKNARGFAIGLLVLEVISAFIKVFIVYARIQSVGIYVAITAAAYSLLVTLIPIGLLIATIKGYGEQKKYGAICGIITCVLMIISRDTISLIFGILYLIDCIKILSYMNKQQG